ncbi:glycosyltransferase [Streptomyces sp. HUCO-GS316]|uniref:glycosyltransferase n=1 Tax=Streptomyces sp. HUCO-GS316 TaxID=2692198 RepID=UPI00301BF566
MKRNEQNRTRSPSRRGSTSAGGDAVIVMDTDLQDPPRVSLELIDAWREGAEIVHARRRTRQDTASKRTTEHFHYRLLRSSTEVDIPLDTGDFRLLDRRVADELRRYRERSRFVRGIVASPMSTATRSSSARRRRPRTRARTSSSAPGRSSSTGVATARSARNSTERSTMNRGWMPVRLSADWLIRGMSSVHCHSCEPPRTLSPNRAAEVAAWRPATDTRGPAPRRRRTP